MKDVLKIHFLLLGVFTLFFLVNSAGAETCSSRQCHSAVGANATVHAPVQGNECDACHVKQGEEMHPSGKGSDFTLAADGADLCFGCHDRDSFTGDNMHGPVAHGSCTVCHLPHGSDFDRLLRLSVKDLCFYCHTDFADNIANARYVHSAILERDCAACHNPHGSGNAYLLRGDSTELCFECHTEMRDKYRRSLNRHKPLYVEDKCGNCHSSHFSDHASLLILDSKELCYSCHGRTDTSRSSALRNIEKEVEGKAVVHAPLAEEGCSGCHDAHGSSYSLLLTGPYPGSFYSPYRPELYGLCFQCHDPDLLASERTERSTGFRNGAVNLHYLHVGIPEKGRTCRACHSVHASDGQKLINPDGIPFGDWKIPIKFTASETGGGCVPGCHRPMSYDREQPVDNAVKDEVEPDVGG